MWVCELIGYYLGRLRLLSGWVKEDGFVKNTYKVIKSGNRKSCYEIKHKNFNQSCAPGSDGRTRRINEVWAATRLITVCDSTTAYECSLWARWTLGGHKKTFTDWKMIKSERKLQQKHFLVWKRNNVTLLDGNKVKCNNLPSIKNKLHP